MRFLALIPLLGFLGCWPNKERPCFERSFCKAGGGLSLVLHSDCSGEFVQDLAKFEIKYSVSSDRVTIDGLGFDSRFRLIDQEQTLQSVGTGDKSYSSKNCQVESTPAPSASPGA